ncbi:MULTISPECIES: hypothetical protein [unclassified Stappia]|uniref:hypothetical protein n=1 Tax=unclassified Stappia TaxID=2629676 RepID=UPI001643B903|nr:MULTISPECIES: hypothetical protein [unclassified Stappia]
MSAKVSSATHDKLKAHVGPIHDEIGKLTLEIDRIRSERAILQAMAVTELDGMGLSRDAVGSLAAACW